MAQVWDMGQDGAPDALAHESPLHSPTFMATEYVLHSPRYIVVKEVP